MDQVRDVMRLKHFAFRTEQTYVSWIKRFIFFHNKKHPREMGNIRAIYGTFSTFKLVDNWENLGGKHCQKSDVCILYTTVV